MTKTFKNAVFIFRRDLRIQDNTALTAAIKHSEHLLPIFIFDPEQSESQNRFFSTRAFTFMVESLNILHNDLQEIGSMLCFAQGRPEEIIERLLAHSITYDAIFFNADYTPFSISRDKKIKILCNRSGISCNIFHDALLIGNPSALINTSNAPYKKFSAFFAMAQTINPILPHQGELQASCPLPTNIPSWIEQGILPASLTQYTIIEPEQLILHGGSRAGRALLRNIPLLTNYAQTRNQPDELTSMLSAHNKFGTLSIRTVYNTIREQLGFSHELIRQLYWRDFFTYLLFHFPQTLTQSARPEYEPNTWNNSEEDFQCWCTGNTGIPIIDAGMHQLNTTGYMHNRVRMLTASYLTKNLHIDWRKGAQYFAQQLIDYDPALNAGNWQWVSSTGYDAQPPFRTFNPDRQAKLYDPENRYINRWR